MLAVTRVGGQTFVFVAAQKGDGYTAHQVPVTLGETVGNTYPVLSGLNPGDKVIFPGCSFSRKVLPSSLWARAADVMFRGAAVWLRIVYSLHLRASRAG